MRILSQRRLRQASPLSADVPCFLFVGNAPAVCDLSRRFCVRLPLWWAPFRPMRRRSVQNGSAYRSFAGEAASRGHKAHCPASFAFHFLRRHIPDRLFDSRPQVRTLLARKLLSTGGREAALRVFSLRLHHFFLARRARCFLAAFMLSTRLGYLRPAFLACRLAAALPFGVKLVWRLFFGAAFFQGSLEDEVLAMPSIRGRQAAWFY